jgi:hypothetical protein
MKTTITSRELLAMAGIATEEKASIPPEHRHLLITSVLKFVPALKLREVLGANGVVSSRDVLAWQQATREWLGLPPAGRGKTSADYRQAIQAWLQTNGNPTLEEIDAGWLPAHRREEKSLPSPILSSRYQKMLEEFRRQVARLTAAKDDDEVRLLLAHYINRPLED